MTTGYEGLDLLLALILAAATFWYGYTIVDELINIFKKKTYWLTVYDKNTNTYVLTESYQERSMRKAIVNHLLSYECDLALLKFQTYIKYNEIAMVYTLEIDGETRIFSMYKERDKVAGESDEQR